MAIEKTMSHVEREIYENEIGQMRQEVERLREDAKRYRWLRNNASTEDLFGIELWLCDTDEEIDAAIDEAMREGK